MDEAAVGEQVFCRRGDSMGSSCQTEEANWRPLHILVLAVAGEVLTVTVAP
jgi:hypothetical protein